MRLSRLALWGWLTWLAYGPLNTAQAGPESLTLVGETFVTAVVDGDTLVIDPPINGADQIRLVGLQAPKLPLGRPGFTPWPLGADSKQALEDLVLNKAIRLYQGGQGMDRHGRLLAHLVRQADGLWVQAALLEAGMARVYSFPDNRALVVDMLAVERGARSARRGIWADPFYAVRQALDLPSDKGAVDGFHLVEGRILDVVEVKGHVYLNFERDWRRDFTIRIEKKTVKNLREEGVDPLAWKGARVRVRGWLTFRNGPEIRLTHPEQLEVLALP
ncbi:MAG: thermonuclease family protein [Rhodospirillales bacterium]